MTFSDLHREYSDELIGEGIYGIVRELASMIASRYPETIYNDGLSWDAQSIDDLSQEVVLNQLLGQNQIHYIFDHATSTESVRRLMTMQVKRALSSRRKKRPIDRLLIRISELAKDGVLERVENGIPYYRPIETQNGYQPLTEANLNACVREIAPIPRLDSRLDSDRETMVYTPARLLEVVQAVFGVVVAVTEKDLRQILGVLLTPWAPASLVPDEGVSLPSSSSAEDSIEEEQMITAAQSLAESLSHDQRVVLVLKSQNISDAQIASEIGVKRPKVADMKQTLLGRVGQELIRDLQAKHHERALEYLLERCNALIEDVSQ